MKEVLVIGSGKSEANNSTSSSRKHEEILGVLQKLLPNRRFRVRSEVGDVLPPYVLDLLIERVYYC